MILYQKTALKRAKINLCHLFTFFFYEHMWRKICEYFKDSYSLNPKFNRSYKKGQYQAIAWKTSKLVIY